MGVSVLYQAIPPESAFSKRLQIERPLTLLVASVFPCGNGLFRLFDLVPEDEISEVLDFAMERYPDALGRGVEARHRWVQQLRDEIQRTRAAFPGIEERAVWLE
ncbi:MAG: hypothetical protein JO325_06575, partial [Solirubrobacterales bacterium]|nr:hypothetical protein [Solirubrobacterales bacterium]